MRVRGMSILLRRHPLRHQRPPVVGPLVALAAQRQPDLVVLAGDITQRATRQFRAAKAFVDRLGAPVLAVPGNHDIALFDLWARLTRPYARFAEVFAPTSSRFTHRRTCWSSGSTPRALAAQERGSVGRAGRPCGRPAGLGESAAVARGGGASARGGVLRADRADLVRGHQAALRAWSVAGADLVLGGHIHLPYTLAPPVCTAAMGAQAGTAVSWRTRAEVPNSVNILRWGEAAAAL